MFNNKIELFQTERNWSQIREQVYNIIDKEHKNGKAQKGEIVFELEEKLCQKFDRKFCITTGNCSDALTIACLSLNLAPYSKIGVSNFTFIASAHAIARARHIAVPIDITDNCTIDTNKIKDVDAILAVDIFGNISNWKEIKKLGIPTINDAAQSLESHDGLQYSAKYGDISCISFSPSKTVSSWGSGGAILTDDPDIANNARLLRLHGKSSNSDIAIGTGLNSMISTFEAACVYSGLSLSEEWQSRRSSISNYLIDVSKYDCNLDKLEKHTYHKLVFESPARDDIIRKIDEKFNIKCGIHYKTSVNDEKQYNSKIQYKVSDKKKLSVFTVPNQHTLTDTEVEIIGKALQ